MGVKTKLRQLFRMYRLYARLDWLWLVRDARSAVVTVLCDWVATLSSIGGIGLLAIRFGGIGSLSADEIWWMLSFFTLADGVTFMLLGSNNVLHISRRVGRGQVDHMLIQPCPLLVQLVTEGFMPFTGNSVFLSGLGLMIYSTARLGIAVTPGWVLLLLGYIIARMVIAVSMSFIVGASAFYKPVSCEEISSVAIDALNATGKVPLAALPDWLVIFLSTALPVGLMAYLPSLILLGKVGATGVAAWPFVLAAVLLSCAVGAFRKGLKHYGTNGCPRYKDMGFRC